MAKSDTTPDQVIEWTKTIHMDLADDMEPRDFDRAMIMLDANRDQLHAAQHTAKALHECYLFLCDELPVSDAYPENKKFYQRVIDALAAWQKSGGAV